MEVGAHVWLRSPQSRWGWVPARIVDREEIIDTTTAAMTTNKKKGKQMVRLTLRDDVGRTTTEVVVVFNSMTIPTIITNNISRCHSNDNNNIIRH